MSTAIVRRADVEEETVKRGIAAAAAYFFDVPVTDLSEESLSQLFFDASFDLLQKVNIFEPKLDAVDLYRIGILGIEFRRRRRGGLVLLLDEGHVKVEFIHEGIRMELFADYGGDKESTSEGVVIYPWPWEEGGDDDEE